MMATDSVKFLNTECLLEVSSAVSRHQLENARYEDHIEDVVREQLGRMLGHLVMTEKATMHTMDYPDREEWIYRAEAYVLSIADAKKLYDMIRDEIRTERRARDDMAVPAVIEAIKALRDEPKRYWDADVDNFADELITRLQGES